MLIITPAEDIELIAANSQQSAARVTLGFDAIQTLRVARDHLGVDIRGVKLQVTQNHILYNEQLSESSNIPIAQ